MQGITIARSQQADRLLRSAHATGAATASSTQGPMLHNDLFAVALDTTNQWGTSVAGTGTVARQVVGARPVIRLDCPAGLDKALLYGLKRVWSPGAASPTRDIWQRLTLEWEMAFTNVANMPNTEMFAGLGALANERSDNDMAGFILASDALNTLTDSAGTETVNIVASPPTLTVFNRYKVVIRNGAIEFWVNNTLKNTHTTNIVAVPVNPILGTRSEAAVASRLEIAHVRCYFSD